MVKKLLFTFFLLEGGFTAHAQLAAPVPTLEAASPTAGDSVAAVNKLFQRKRLGSIAWMVAGVSGAVRALLAASEGQTDLGSYSYGAPPVRQSANASGVVTGAAITLGFEAIGISKARRYSAAKQETLVQQLQQGKPVPATIRHRLKAKDFR